MKTLVLRLRGTQSWGRQSRFDIRDTSSAPTKSGVVGLLAAALGRPRGSDNADLFAMEMAVRVDDPGVLVRDFHTFRKNDKGEKAVTKRDYLDDANFLVAISADDDLIEMISGALRNPRFALALGRRCCVPIEPLFGTVTDHDIDWIMEHWDHPKDRRPRRVIRDAEMTDPRRQITPEIALPGRRGFAQRAVVERQTLMTKHNPFDL